MAKTLRKADRHRGHGVFIWLKPATFAQLKSKAASDERPLGYTINKIVEGYFAANGGGQTSQASAVPPGRKVNDGNLD